MTKSKSAFAAAALMLAPFFAVSLGGDCGQARKPTEASEPEAPETGFDRYGDALPKGAVARLGTVRWRSGESLASIRFSPDGKYIASVEMGAVRLWDVSTGRVAWKSEEPVEDYNSLAFSPNGKTLAAVANDLSSLPDPQAFQSFKLYFWDLGTRRKKAQVTLKLDPDKAGGLFLGEPVFSADSKLVAVTASDGLVRVYNPENGKLISKLVAGQSRLLSSCFSPDSQLLIVSADDSSVLVYNPENGKLISKLPAGESRVLSCCFSSDGKELISGSADGTFRSWQTASWKLIQSWRPKVDVNEDIGIFFAPGGRYAALPGDSLVLLDLIARKEIASINQEVRNLTFSNDGKRLAFADANAGRTFLVDLTTAKVARMPGKANRSLVFSADNSLLACIHFNAIKTWDVKTGKEKNPFAAVDSPVTHLTVSPDTVSPDGANLAGVTLDGQIFLGLWNSAKCQASIEKTIKEIPFRVDIAFTPDGKTLAVCSQSTICLWNLATGAKQVLSTEDELSLLSNVTIAPNGKLVVAYQARKRDATRKPDSKDSSIFLWNLDTRAIRKRIDVPDEVRCFAFSPSSKLLAFGFNQGNVHIWDVEAGRERRRIEADGAIPTIAFSANEKTLAVIRPSPGLCEIWETATGNRRTRIKIGDAMEYTFGRKGRLLACSDEEGKDTVHIWDLYKSAEIRRFSGHKGIRCLTFFPDGDFLATGGNDTTVLIWDLRDLDLSSLSPALKAKPQEIDVWWRDLTAFEAEKAHKAMNQMVAASGQSLAYMKLLLRPEPSLDKVKVTELISKLDDPEFEQREKATTELRRLGEVVAPCLKARLKAKPSAEMRRRAEQLMEDFDIRPSPEHLRLLRVIEILEEVGTSDAKVLLKRMAQGEPQSSVTQDAILSLQRLEEKGTGKKKQTH